VARRSGTKGLRGATHPGLLVSSPLPFPVLPPGAVGPPHRPDEWWWIGCHGGAGISTLARLTGGGRQAREAIPTPAPGDPRAAVLVTRATAFALWQTMGVIEQWKQRNWPADLRLLGLVVVAATPRRRPPRGAPRIVEERIEVMKHWLPGVWRICWIDHLLAVDDPAAVGMPPDVAALRDDIRTQLGTRGGPS
jgi:hypothetical protein